MTNDDIEIRLRRPQLERGWPWDNLERCVSLLLKMPFLASLLAKESTMSSEYIKVTMRRPQLKRAWARDNLERRFAALAKTPRLEQREDVWREAVKQIGADADLTVLEFGVYKGRSMRFWAEHFKNAAARFVGFDSFTGLPEDWAGRMRKGSFDVGGAVPAIGDDRVSFVPGWFQNTYVPFLATAASQIRPTLLVHCDADLYSATLFVLSTSWHHFDSFYVVFDEFAVDENLALGDFAAAYPVEIEFFAHTMGEAQFPAQVFGRVEKTIFKPE